MSDSIAVVVSASVEVDEELARVVERLSRESFKVVLVGPGAATARTRSLPDVELHVVSLAPTKLPEVEPSSHHVRIVRIAYNLLLLNPWRLVTSCLWVDPRCVLLDYPELTVAAIELEPRVVLADGREMLRTAHRVASVCGAQLMYSPRDGTRDRRRGMVDIRLYQRALLVLRELRYRRYAEVVGPTD